VDIRDANVIASVTQGDSRTIYFDTHDDAAKVSEAMTEATGIAWGIKALEGA